VNRTIVWRRRALAPSMAHGEDQMVALLWVLIVLLLVVWVVGFVIAHIVGPIIHLFLIVALILLIWNLLFSRGRTSV
jgi:Flp pilus assembly protein TadB